MANAEKDVEGKKRKRVGNIITIEEGDSQESLEKVSDFIFFYFKSSLRYSFFSSLSFTVSPSWKEDGEWRATSRGAWRRTSRGPWSATARGSASAVSPASSLPVQLWTTSQLPLRNPTALKAPPPCCSKLSAFRFIGFSIGAMAAPSEDGKKEKKRRERVIITIKEGDSQESLEEVNNFYFLKSFSY